MITLELDLVYLRKIAELAVSIEPLFQPKADYALILSLLDRIEKLNKVCPCVCHGGDGEVSRRHG